MLFVRYFGGLALFIIGLYNAIVAESLAMTFVFSAMTVFGGMLSASVVNWKR